RGSARRRSDGCARAGMAPAGWRRNQDVARGGPARAARACAGCRALNAGWAPAPGATPITVEPPRSGEARKARMTAHPAPRQDDEALRVVAVLDDLYAQRRYPCHRRALWPPSAEIG